LLKIDLTLFSKHITLLQNLSVLLKKEVEEKRQNKTKQQFGVENKGSQNRFISTPQSLQNNPLENSFQLTSLFILSHCTLATMQEFLAVFCLHPVGLFFCFLFFFSAVD
jgi:hypothetical protein